MAKKEVLWSEVLKKVEVPKVIKTLIFPRRDIRIIPRDVRTTKTLRNMEKKRKELRNWVGANQR